MDYPYENLSPERFQEFVQSMLTQEYPDTQCFPVGQPDGGRDAISYLPQGQHTGSHQFLMYQVKFVRDPPSLDDPRGWLKTQLRREAPKVRGQLAKGVERYVLVTNIKGSAHPGTGSIDWIEQLLAETLPVPSIAWWRDDLNRRLDSNWNLKWAYPELFTGTDFVRLVLEQGLSEATNRRHAAIRAYLQEQYDRDQEIRFKQVELENRLFDLFIDVPVLAPDQPLRTNPSGTLRRLQRLLARESEATRAEDSDIISNSADSFDRTRKLHGFYTEAEHRRSLGAASTFLHPLVQRYAPCVVLEGAPGQGKSTIVQYICQVQRLRLLRLESDDAQTLPQVHLLSPLRLPFKIDLRDFSYWVTGDDPFALKADEERPTYRQPRSLEAFLADQISTCSGGADFSVDDLLAVLRVSAALVVLDGLDEVADISRRQRVVREIEKGTSRLKANASSLQVLVTSRPAAFANSPGLRPEDLPCYQLGAIDQELAGEYAEKWLNARRVDKAEQESFKEILSNKLDEPHLRDLAKNPMQLTILLSLIHTRGSSLPDKRTALYDSYVELFFNREAEKSAIVREHRDLLIDIHRFLAWSLHAESELGKHRGRISQERLLTTVRDYLGREGHDVELVEDLFAGMVERVVAIVSRAEGTFEFEVQPLREYFAARFLYETAPYSPTGAEMTGTKPDRFDALARNFYWLNVARFYGGCYSKGELSSLIDGIKDLLEDQGYRLTNHPRSLAMSLLADYVFAQQPRSVGRLMKLVLGGRGVRLLLSNAAPWGNSSESVALPDQGGREVLLSQCFRLLETGLPRDYAREAIEVIRVNSGNEASAVRWWREVVERSGEERARWLEYGAQLNVVGFIGLKDLVDLANRSSEDERFDLESMLLGARRFDYFHSSRERFRRAMELYLDAQVDVTFFGRSTQVLDGFGQSLWPGRYVAALSRGGPVEVRTGWVQYFGSSGMENWNPEDMEGPGYSAEQECRDWLKVMAECVRLTEHEWATSLDPWDRVVEEGRRHWGDHWSWIPLANLAAGIRSKKETATTCRNLLDSDKPLCGRARYARLRAGNASWWKRSFREAGTPSEIALCVLVLLSWGSSKTVLACLEDIEGAVDRLPEEDFQRVLNQLDMVHGWLRHASGLKGLHVDAGRELITVSVDTLALLAPRRGRGWQAIARRMAAETERVAVVRKALEVSLQGLLKEKPNWQELLGIFELAYTQNVGMEGYPPSIVGRRSRVREMPVDIAEKVMRNPERFPSSLIRVAEDVCRQNVAREAVPVATTAARDNWFVR